MQSERTITNATLLLSRYINSIPEEVAVNVRGMIADLRKRDVDDLTLCKSIGIYDQMAFNQTYFACDIFDCLSYPLYPQDELAAASASQDCYERFRPSSVSLYIKNIILYSLLACS